MILLRKTKEDADRTRKDILKAALNVFSTKGYSSTTLDEIAKCAKVTRGAIYWHFENKANLYNTLLNEANTRVDHVVAQAIQSGGTYKEIIKRIMIAQWQLLEEDAEYRATVTLFMFNTGVAPELEGSRKTLLENFRLLVETIEGYMKEAIATGQIRNDKSPVELTHAFLAYQQGLAVNWLQCPALFSIKEMAPMLADIFIDGI